MSKTVGQVPMKITAQIPGGEPFPLGTVHLDLVVRNAGYNGSPVYEIGADLNKIRRTIETIFASHQDDAGADDE